MSSCGSAPCLRVILNASAHPRVFKYRVALACVCTLAFSSLDIRPRLLLVLWCHCFLLFHPHPFPTITITMTAVVMVMVLALQAHSWCQNIALCCTATTGVVYVQSVPVYWGSVCVCVYFSSCDAVKCIAPSLSFPLLAPPLPSPSLPSSLQNHYMDLEKMIKALERRVRTIEVHKDKVRPDHSAPTGHTRVTV